MMMAVCKKAISRFLQQKNHFIGVEIALPNEENYSIRYFHKQGTKRMSMPEKKLGKGNQNGTVSTVGFWYYVYMFTQKLPDYLTSPVPAGLSNIRPFVISRRYKDCRTVVLIIKRVLLFRASDALRTIGLSVQVSWDESLRRAGQPKANIEAL